MNFFSSQFTFSEWNIFLEWLDNFISNIVKPRNQIASNWRANCHDMEGFIIDLWTYAVLHMCRLGLLSIIPKNIWWPHTSATASIRERVSSAAFRTSSMYCFPLITMIHRDIVATLNGWLGYYKLAVERWRDMAEISHTRSYPSWSNSAAFHNHWIAVMYEEKPTVGRAFNCMEIDPTSERWGQARSVSTHRWPFGLYILPAGVSNKN